MATLTMTKLNDMIIDMEWKKLMIEARDMGLTIEEVRGILQQLIVKNQ